MRKLLVALVALALLASACGGDGTSTTSDASGATTTSVASGTTTTGAAATVTLDCAANVAPASAGVMCADYADGIESQPENVTLTDFFQPVEAGFGAMEVDGQQCLTTGEVLVYPAFPEDEIPASLTLADVPDDVAGYLDAIQLGLYVPASGDVLATIDELEADFDVVASPHYLLGPTQTWKYSPAGSPTPLQQNDWGSLPPGQDKDSGMAEGVRVIVVDTGGSPDDPDDASKPVLGVTHAEQEASGLHPAVEGHGQFIASIVNRYNPGLIVEIYNASDTPNGQASELAVVTAIGRVVEIDGAVVNLSLGTYPCRASDPPLGLAAGLTVLPQEVANGENLNVRFAAASGNDGPNHPAMYPAMLSSVPIEQIFPLGPGDPGQLGQVIEMLGGPASIVAVGATDRTGAIAGFSNDADVYVPGESVVGWYAPTGSLAVWSGTSFAAPRYAACMASGICQP